MSTNPLLEEACVCLRAAGLRVTSRRLLVLRILGESDDYLDAQDIWSCARQIDDSISPATVYRTLNTFKEIGLVKQRYSARDHKREYCKVTGEQECYRFTCIDCGQVIELHIPCIAQARRTLRSQLGLIFTQTCICFEGHCPECAATQ